MTEQPPNAESGLSLPVANRRPVLANRPPRRHTGPWPHTSCDCPGSRFRVKSKPEHGSTEFAASAAGPPQRRPGGRGRQEAPPAGQCPARFQVSGPAARRSSAHMIHVRVSTWALTEASDSQRLRGSLRITSHRLRRGRPAAARPGGSQAQAQCSPAARRCPGRAGDPSQAACAGPGPGLRKSAPDSE